MIRGGGWRGVGARAGALLIGLSLMLLAGCSQGPPWEDLNAAGVAAYRARNFVEAEKKFREAITRAERFGKEDPRLATSLSNLGEVYRAQARLAEAEPLYRRALEIR